VYIVNGVNLMKEKRSHWSCRKSRWPDAL